MKDNPKEGDHITFFLDTINFEKIKDYSTKSLLIQLVDVIKIQHRTQQELEINLECTLENIKNLSYKSNINLIHKKICKDCNGIGHINTIPPRNDYVGLDNCKKCYNKGYVYE